MAESVAPSSIGSELLAGHLGNLTGDQENALAMFKEALAKTDLYTPADEGKKVSHDDSTLLYDPQLNSHDVQHTEGCLILGVFSGHEAGIFKPLKNNS